MELISPKYKPILISNTFDSNVFLGSKEQAIEFAHKYMNQQNIKCAIVSFTWGVNISKLNDWPLNYNGINFTVHFFNRLSKAELNATMKGGCKHNAGLVTSKGFVESKDVYDIVFQKGQSKNQ